MSSKPSVEKIITLIRHGQHHHVKVETDALNHSAVGELADEVTRQEDGGLTPAGIQQAERTAERFRIDSISAIYASSLPRTTQTAEIIAKSLPDVPLQTRRDLWECIPHVPPHKVEQAKVYPGELLARDKAHAAAAFERYFQPADEDGQHEIVVCHGNLIRYFVCRVLQVTPDVWLNMKTYNCGVSTVWIQADGTLTLASFNDTGHLPQDLVTYTTQPPAHYVAAAERAGSA